MTIDPNPAAAAAAESDDPAGAALWRDPVAPVADRVADLIARLTVDEKIAQLSGIWVGIDAAGEVAPHQHDFAGDPPPWAELIAEGVGQLTRPYGTAPIDPATGARGIAASQREIIAANRFGIPAMVHEECLTGLATWQATAYPSPLCWGASFDPDLVERLGARIGALMRRLGVHQGLAPVLDVARDLRWGRVEETIGEDPHLVGLIGSAYVRGLQSAGVVATLKHFVGYSASRGGRNLAPVSIGPRELADVLLPPFEMALRAGARSVMNAYVDLDGVPVAADPTILTDLLRDTYGFTGTVVADYYAVAFLHLLHAVAADPADAAHLALAAGIDIELPTVNHYGAPLRDAVAAGQIPESLIDRALTRVLTQKCELGLLDPTWPTDPPALRAATHNAADPDEAADPFDLDDAESRALAGELARRSIVLLRNTGALPLRPEARLAVIGPRADVPGAMLGCYSFPQHVGVHHPNVPIGVAIPTLLNALRADPNTYRLDHALGCPVTGGADADIAAAARLAADADVCLAVLGDQAGLFGGGTSGEGCDATDLRLPGRQEELLDALLATGTPVVLVLLVGRPYELSRQLDRLAAVVCGFFPGEEGGPALADVLSGRVNPSGRLPVSFPGANANQPATYLAAPLAARSEVSTADPTAVFPFGHGLSYANATWLDVTAPEDWPTNGTCRLTVTLRNDTEIEVSEVIQVYLHDPVAEVARPVQQLIAAPRVTLPPGRSATVHIDLSADLTSYTGRARRRQVDPGAVQLWVGASSTDIRGRVPVTMTGPRRDLGPDRTLEPTVTVVS